MVITGDLDQIINKLGLNTTIDRDFKFRLCSSSKPEGLDWFNLKRLLVENCIDDLWPCGDVWIPLITLHFNKLSGGGHSCTDGFDKFDYLLAKGEAAAVLQNSLDVSWEIFDLDCGKSLFVKTTARIPLSHGI